MVLHMAQKKNGNAFEAYVWDASDISGESIGIGWIRFDSAFGGVIITPDNSPTVDLIASPTLIFSGGSSSLSWTSSNATSCEGTVGPSSWFGSKDLSEDKWETKELYADTVYSIRCANAVSSAEDTVTVFINTLSPSSQCSDGIDNDSDGQTDYPEDTSCSDSSGSDESIPVCGNTKCESGENSLNCPVDCGAVKFEEF